MSFILIDASGIYIFFNTISAIQFLKRDGQSAIAIFFSREIL